MQEKRHGTMIRELTHGGQLEFSKEIADQLRELLADRKKSSRTKLYTLLRSICPDRNTLKRYKRSGIALMVEGNQAVAECDKYEKEHCLPDRRGVTTVESQIVKALRKKRRPVIKLADSRWSWLVDCVFPPPQPQHASPAATSPDPPTCENYTRTITLEWSDSSEDEHEEIELGDGACSDRASYLVHKKQRKH